MTKQAAANILRQLANGPGVIDLTSSRLVRATVQATQGGDKSNSSRRRPRR